MGDDGGVVGSSSSSSNSSGSGIVGDLRRRFGNEHVRKAFSNSVSVSAESSVRAVKPSFFNNSTRLIRRVDILKYIYCIYKIKTMKTH